MIVKLIQGETRVSINRERTYASYVKKSINFETRGYTPHKESTTCHIYISTINRTLTVWNVKDTTDVVIQTYQVGWQSHERTSPLNVHVCGEVRRWNGEGLQEQKSVESNIG